MKLIVFALLCISGFCAEAQQQYVEYQDSILASEFNQVFWEVEYGTPGPDSNGLDPAYNLYLDKFLSLLQNQSSLNYKFPFLAKHIKITSSPDNKLRYFQWPTQRQSMLNQTATILQADLSGKPYLLRMDTAAIDEYSAYNDVTGVYQLKVGAENIYLVTDFSIYGAGITGTTISAYRFAKDSIDFNYPLFYIDSLVSTISNSYFRVKTWELRKKVEVQYNSQEKIFAFMESYDDDELQELYKDGNINSAHEIIELKFDGKVFRPYKKYKAE